MIGIPGLSIPRRRRRASFTGAYDAVPSITAAYGMRRLLTSYTGSLLRMRRSSDNAESDFGYTAAGHLDTAAIVAWLSGSGYIVKWYDQSGNGYDAVQTAEAARQPLYVASGQNGRPVLRWDGVDDYLDAIFGADIPQPITMMALAKRVGGVSTHLVLAGIDAAKSNRLFIRGNDLHISAQGDSLGAGGQLNVTATQTIFNVATGIYHGASSSLHVNGSSSASGTLGTNAQSGVRIGAPAALTSYLGGDIASILICNAALSTGDRQAAESAANAYWQVY